jgi:uncharacterized protein YqcC (DUF446 family)
VADTEFILRVETKLNEIEAEMHSIGMWQLSPLRPEQLEFAEAFGADTMAFSQWLQFVFVPRVRQAIAADQFPGSSSVGVKAVREFDTEPNASRLTKLLSEFDKLFEPD